MRPGNAPRAHAAPALPASRARAWQGLPTKTQQLAPPAAAALRCLAALLILIELEAAAGFFLEDGYLTGLAAVARRYTEDWAAEERRRARASGGWWEHSVSTANAQSSSGEPASNEERAAQAIIGQVDEELHNLRGLQEGSKFHCRGYKCAVDHHVL